MHTVDKNNKKAPLLTGKWTSLIDEIVSDQWFNSELGRVLTVDYERIKFEASLDGAEADLVGSLKLGNSFAVVCDPATYDVLGQRVAKNIASLGRVEIIVLDHPPRRPGHCGAIKTEVAALRGRGCRWFGHDQ